MSSKKEFDVALVQLREAINKGYDFDTGIYFEKNRLDRLKF